MRDDTLASRIKRNALAARAAPFWSGEHTISHRKLADYCARLATLADRRGWTPGGRVAIVTRKGPEAAVLFAGLIACGRVAVILDPDLPDERLGHLARAARLDGALCDPERAPTLRAAVSDVVSLAAPTPRPRGLITRMLAGLEGDGTPALDALLADLPGGAPDGRSAPEAIAYIMFTSGSTSVPKGVQISHGALSAQLDEFAAQWRVASGNRILNFLPLHHTDGLNMGPMLAIRTGATVVRPFDFALDRLGDVLDGISRYAISHAVFVPSLLALLLEHASEDDADAFDTPAFETLISTAAPLDPGLWTRFQETFGVRVSNCYGLTETVSQVLYCGPDDASWRHGTVGRPVGARIRIVDDAGRDVDAGTTGELLVRGATLMSGYFDAPEATAEVLGSDGWLRSGDLAVRDPDGAIRIVGRKKAVIITGGINIHPEAVNEAARTCPGVRDAATLGVPDPVWGERAVLVVEPAVGGGAVDPDTLAAALVDRLPPESRPWRIMVEDDLPRGPSDKVAMPELRTRGEARLAGPGEPAKGSGGVDTGRVMALAARNFGLPVDRLQPEMTANDVPGWTSLAHLELLLAIEKEAGIRFTTRDIMSLRSLGDICRTVEAGRAPR